MFVDNEPSNLIMREYDDLHELCLVDGWCAVENNETTLHYERVVNPYEAEIIIELKCDSTIDVTVPVKSLDPARYYSRYKLSFASHAEAIDFVTMHVNLYDGEEQSIDSSE